MRLAAALLAASVCAGKALAPSPSDYVHNEGVVSAAAEKRLSARLARFERETGKQFVVALFRTLESESLEDYSNRLFRHWKIGDAKRNNGLLFALFLSERKWRVEVGYGLEGTLTDAEAGRIAREHGVPHFKERHFDQGVEAIVAALEAKLRGQTLPRPPPPSQAPPNADGSELGNAIFAGFVIIVIVLFFVALIKGGGGTIGGSSNDSSWSSSSDWGSSSSGGDFSGGGGSSGGGGASGGW